MSYSKNLLPYVLLHSVARETYITRSFLRLYFLAELVYNFIELYSGVFAEREQVLVLRLLSLLAFQPLEFISVIVDLPQQWSGPHLDRCRAD